MKIATGGLRRALELGSNTGFAATKHCNSANLSWAWRVTAQGAEWLLPRRTSREIREMNIGDIHLTAAALADAIAENVQGAAGRRECDDYFVPFGKRAEALDAEDKPELADAFRFLSLVTSFRLKPDNEHEPLVSWFTNGAGVLSIDHLTDEQLAVVAQVVSAATDAELRARLADLVWIRKRDYNLAQVAVAAYTESAEVDSGKSARQSCPGAI